MDSFNDEAKTEVDFIGIDVEISCSEIVHILICGAILMGKKKNGRKNIMKILVVSQYYYPEPFRVHEICEALVQKGHEVTVLTEFPNYPDGEIYQGYTSNNRLEIINGVKVIRCDARPRHQGNFHLALNYLSFVYHGNRVIRKIDKDFDVVYVYQLSPVIMALPAIKYKKKHNVPMYLYCLDLWPESAKDVFSNERSLPYRIMTAISKYIYKSADLIGVTSKPFVNYLKQVCGVDEKQLVYLPQHADDLAQENDLYTVENGCVDFMFMGNIGQTQDLDNVLDAVEMIRDIEGFKVHIVGSGSYYETLQQHTREKKLDNLIVFHGRHPISEMPAFYRLADVCLLTMKGDSAVGLTIPGKLQGYMSAGKPILGAINGASVDVIKEAECGICVPASDSNALAEAMYRLINSPKTFDKMGKNSRSYFLKNFTVDRHVGMLTKQLNMLIETS